MKKIFYVLFFLLLSHVAIAGGELEPEEILKTSVNEVLTVLADEEMALEQKKEKVIEITDQVFDLTLMAKLSVGKKYWSKFNPEQKSEFTKLFIKKFQGFYVDKIDLFSDEKVEFLPPITVNKKKVKIPTVLSSKDKKYSILYMMFKTSRGWKIYDVSIEGVSILHTDRQQFQNILASGKVKDLLSKMREKVKNENS
ncbi:MAG: toluene tolerance protein [Candidatus Scalindua sp.]|nr:ABC transporter substrate-binding protein [Planctomycetota bacterium]GJQ59183.1 MAG: toluene tolerance protein [Candidatus Scalindua sp.]